MERDKHLKKFEETVNQLVVKHNITDIHAACYLCNYGDKFICHEFNNGCDSVDKCKSIYEKEKLWNS